MQLPFHPAISLTSQQSRLLRLSFFSLGSICILYWLFSISSSGSHGSSSPSLPGYSGHSSFECLDSAVSVGVQFDNTTGLYRYSDEHPWINPGTPRRRILAGSHFTAHEDVYMSLLHTISSYTDSIRVYAKGFRWGFEDVVQDLNLYSGKYYDPEQIVSDLSRDNLFSNSEDRGKKADMVILGTCEIDMEHFSQKLFEQYLARGEDEKFTLVCIVHNAFSVEWLVEYGADWVREGALRVMPISEHVKRVFMYHFDSFADSPDTHQYGYDLIPIDVHVPVLPLKIASSRGTSEKMLTKAIVQGNFDPNRRDYEGIFQDLVSELTADPVAWGYHPVTEAEPTFKPNPNGEVTPFELHLAGDGQMNVPDMLKEVVVVHTGLSYPEFFKLMSSMDVAIPAFSKSTKGGYYEVQASSSVAMAMMCEVPLLTTRHIHKVYTYTRSSSVSINRPTYLREIAALRVLRAGWFEPIVPEIQPDGRRSMPPGAEEEIRSMIQAGWKRTPEGWTEWKKELDVKNHMAARRLLDGW